LRSAGVEKLMNSFLMEHWSSSAIYMINNIRNEETLFYYPGADNVVPA
jgi:hypothetical protein